MFSPKPLVDARGASYARLASRVLEALNEAVSRRISDGRTRSDIAAQIGCHRSQLTRVLNGTIPNLTLKTVSDILWATDHEPRDFAADTLEDISHNCHSFADEDRRYKNDWVIAFVAKTHAVNDQNAWISEKKVETFSFSEASN